MFTFIIPFVSNTNITGNMAAVLPGILSDFTNENRQQQNLPALTVSPLLTEAAQLKANDMATNGYFAHASPAGKTPWYWLDQVGYDYQYAGENFAVNFRFARCRKCLDGKPDTPSKYCKRKLYRIRYSCSKWFIPRTRNDFVVQDYANPMPVAKTNTITADSQITKAGVQRQHNASTSDCAPTAATRSRARNTASAEGLVRSSSCLR